MIPWVLLVVTVLFYLTTGWVPYLLYVPVTLGMLVASLVAAWALLVRRRPHAELGFPLLAIPTALVLLGPVDVSVSPRAPLGVRLVPVVYGLLADRGPADRGEIDSRGCLVPANPKRWTVQIGYRPPGLEEWGRRPEPTFEVDAVQTAVGEATIAAESGSSQH